MKDINYDEMSDFEINKRVAYVDDVDGDIESIQQRKHKLKCLNCIAIVKLNGIDEVVAFNPCNDPSDAWTIILKNKISITPQHTGDGFWSASWSDTSILSWQDMPATHFARDKNPLRAAMICFLKMKDYES